MNTARTFLPYGRHTIEDDDIEAVSSALRSNLLTTGPLVEAFERDFAAISGARFAVVCNSGTAALHLAALALDVGPGDAVIVPSVTFIATANVVRMTGAEVIFADVDENNGLLTSETFEKARTGAGSRHPKACIPVHLNGRPCAMAELSALAERHGVSLFE